MTALAAAKAALEAAQKAYNDAKNAERANVLASIKATVKEYEFTASELGLKAGKGGKRAATEPKYVNPANANETWSGRGRKPGWIVTFLENGGDLEKIKA